MNNGITLVIFDLDGTLSRTDIFSVPAIQDVQRELGFPVSDRETLINCYGNSFNDFMNILFPGGDQETFKNYNALIPIAEQKYIHNVETYTGVEAMLISLKAKGYCTAVCSNASSRYIVTMIKALKLTEKIDYIQELEPQMKNKGESLRNLLFNVSPEKAIMIGDTLFDKNAADYNNIPFVGCKYGYRPYEMENVENSVSSPLEIPIMVDNILS